MAPRHAHDHAMMSLQAALLCAVLGCPQDDAAIVATTSQARSVWTPRHSPDRRRLPMTDPPTGACRHFPHLHLLLIGSSGQKLPIGTPFNAEEGGVEMVGVTQGLHQGTCSRIPHLDNIVQPTA